MVMPEACFQHDGWYYLSTILDDFSLYIVAWKLCSSMKAGDVTDTLEMALAASGLDQADVRRRSICVRITSYVRSLRQLAGSRPPFADLSQRSYSNVIQAASAVKEEALGHSKPRIHNAVHWSSPSLTRDAIPSGKPDHYLQGR